MSKFSINFLSFTKIVKTKHISFSKQGNGGAKHWHDQNVIEQAFCENYFES